MRTRGRSAIGTPAVPKPPLVVTIDNAGDLVDLVGDIEVFVGEGESADHLVQRLLDLLEGAGGHAAVLQAVELSPGRYADIHVVAEGDLRHFVVLDASDVMQALQRTQQLSHEAALEREHEHRVLRSTSGEDRTGRQGAAFRPGAGLFSAIVTDMRESLVLLSGHARILARHCAGDEVALRSVAAVQHAVVQLDALSSNGLIALGGLTAGASRPGAVDLRQLAAFLHDAFALQAKGQGIGFEVHLPEAGTMVEIDDLAFRQVLINLLAHALDGMTHGELVLSLSQSLGARHVEVEISTEPQGFRVAHFGPLVTTSELLHSNTMGSLALAVSQQILRRMDAELELVPRKEGGCLVWFRVPVRQPGSNAFVAAASTGPTVAVVVQPVQMRDAARKQG